MIRAVTGCMIAAVILVAAPAVADWDPGDPYKMHFPQLPDLSDTGMDVWDTTYYPDPTWPQKWLADDWQCTQTGPVTDIHVWGSWLYDQVPPGATHGTFDVAIYSDVPADPPDWSHPGDPLWKRTFGPGSYKTRLYAEAYEAFYDPNKDEIIGMDTEVWQYNFLIPEPEAFPQKEGTIYWLAITHYDPNEDGTIDSLDTEFIYGWKTSLDHWNDDAVFTDAPFGAIPPGPWKELRYPIGHPYEGESIDLAFVITPEPTTLTLLALGGLVLVRRR